MRVLLIGDRCGPGGGTGGQLALAARGLAQRGHRVVVLVAEPAEHPIPGVEILVLPRRRALGGHMRWLSRIDARIRSFDGLAMSWIRGPSAGLWRAGGGAHRAWMSVRGPAGAWAAHRDRRELSREARSLSAARIVVVNSERAARDLQTSCGRDPQGCRRVRNGVDLERFQPRTATRSGRVAVFVGQGWWRKGLDLALAAFAQVAGRHDRLRVLASPEDLRAAWRAARLRPDARVSCHPPRADIERALADADVLLHPSRYDASSNAVLEAMACGLTPVTSAADGVSEILEDPDLIVGEACDVRGVARALRYALDRREPERWRAVAERWPDSRMVSALEEVLMEQWRG